MDVINIFFSSQPIFSFNVFRDAADVGGEVDDKERDIKRGGSVLFEVDVSLQGSRKFIQYLLVSITAIMNLENVKDIAEM